MDSNAQQSVGITERTRDIDEKYKLTAVGCLVDFLKANGPASLESLIAFVKLKRDVLLTAKGEKFLLSPSGIVNYVLGWHSKIFLSDGNFSYSLDEEEAAKWESEWKYKEGSKTDNYELFRTRNKRESEASKQRRKAMKRIKLTIESDLKKTTEEYSPITKAYLVLISGNNEAAADLTQLVRKAYTDLVTSRNNKE